MELHQDNRAFCTPLTVLNTVAEQLADVDLTLPDYCPDIEKILKCALTPKIQSKALSGGQLQIDGVCVVSVLYVESGKKTIRCCEHSVTFSQSFTVRDEGENDIVLTKTKSEYINCRALSPRRMVIHGAFSLYAKVIAVQKNELYAPPKEQNLEILTQNMRLADLKSNCQEQFTVSEEISVADKPPVEAVLYSKVTAGVTDAKAVSGKLMLNGEIGVRLFYLTNLETGETAKLDYLLPFSQIIDCAGMGDDTDNLICCEVLSYDIRLKNDVLSDKPAIAFDAALCVSAQGYLSAAEQVVTDAFSTEFAAAPQFCPLKSVAQARAVSDTFMEKLTAKIDNAKISKVLDIYADFVTLDAAPAEGGLKAKGKINLCILALNEENFPVFVERSCEYERPLPSAEGCNLMLFDCARVLSISYRLSDENSIDIRCELKIEGGALQSETTDAVCGVEIFEDRPVSRDGCALVLYFASAGEKLWEIAKAHSTKPALLLSENAPVEAVLDSDKMLLIPKL